jgi:GR25 family glycosyltransferase involved in LPS biosynthesis
MRIEKLKAVRILNITQSHLKLIREANQNDFDGILILEDDAEFQRSDLLGSFLEKIMQISSALPIREHYVDLSESFSLLELGAAHLIVPLESQKIVIEDNVFNVNKMRVPITNTVCAVLYSPEFARVLEKALSKKLTKRFEKYIPIDWLINKILIELCSENSRVSCYTTNPGIFRQKSIVRSSTSE